MESNVTEDNIREVRVIETDQAAVSAIIRRLELFICIFFIISLAIAIWAFCIYVPQYNNPMFHYLLICLIGTCFILLGIIHFVGPLFLKKSDVLIGNDFIAAPEYGNNLIASLVGRKIVVNYGDIKRILLDISKDRITGATVVGKGSMMISVRRIKGPLVVIRAIRENTGPEVQWRKSPPRLKKLSMDDVDFLIDKEEKIQ